VRLAHEPIHLGPAGWELAAAWAVAAPRCAHAVRLRVRARARVRVRVRVS